MLLTDNRVVRQVKVAPLFNCCKAPGQIGRSYQSGVLAFPPGAGWTSPPRRAGLDRPAARVDITPIVL
jgi:hypothetical protein